MGKLYQGTESHDRIDIRNTNFNVVWAKSGVDVVYAREDNDTISGANDQDIINGYGGKMVMAETIFLWVREEEIVYMQVKEMTPFTGVR